MTPLLFVLPAVAYAFVPGAHRALTPDLFGVPQVRAGLYTDAPERAAELETLIADAQKIPQAFFGPGTATPRYIICTEAPCAEVFGLRPRGLALGRHVILIGPAGVNTTILSHEQSHIALHSYMGLSDIVTQRFPAWFNEGLASHLSGDTRFLPLTPVEARFILQARTFRDWSRLHRTGDPGREPPWRRTYGAAAALVADMERQIGKDGLRSLISEVADGAEFDTVLRARMGPDWP